MYRTLKLKKCYLSQSTVLVSPIIIYTVKESFALCCFFVLFSLPVFSYFLNSLIFVSNLRET